VGRDFVVPKGVGVLVRLRVSPGARSNGIGGTYSGVALKLRVAAPPVGGTANAEVEHFVAGPVGAASSGARVVRDLSARDKAAFVDGVDAAGARETVSSYLA
jgi:hypothetical protein